MNLNNYVVFDKKTGLPVKIVLTGEEPKYGDDVTIKNVTSDEIKSFGGVCNMLLVGSIVTKNPNKNPLELKNYLKDTDWLVIRHNDQLALGVTTSLSEEAFKDLLEKRQQVRENIV